MLVGYTLNIIDITDPRQPRVAFVPGIPGSTGVAVWGKRLYTAFGRNVEVVDLVPSVGARRAFETPWGGGTGAIDAERDRVITTKFNTFPVESYIASFETTRGLTYPDVIPLNGIGRNVISAHDLSKDS